MARRLQYHCTTRKCRLCQYVPAPGPILPSPLTGQHGQAGLSGMARGADCVDLRLALACLLCRHSPGGGAASHSVTALAQPSGLGLFPHPPLHSPRHVACRPPYHGPRCRLGGACTCLRPPFSQVSHRAAGPGAHSVSALSADCVVLARALGPLPRTGRPHYLGTEGANCAVPALGLLPLRPQGPQLTVSLFAVSQR